MSEAKESKEAKETNAPLTGEVRDGKALVTQPNGGALQRGSEPRGDPTAADNAALANREINRMIKGISRIARNQKDPRTTGKKAASRKGKYSVNQRISAFRALLDAARLDHTIRESRMAAFLLKVQNEILDFAEDYGMPREQANALLQRIAVHVAEL